MTRKLRPDEHRLWAHVAATVRPLEGRAHPVPPTPDAPKPSQQKGGEEVAARVPPPAAPKPKALRPKPPPTDIEPKRKRRIVRERDPLIARIDLHGLDQDRARAVLAAFLVRAQADGYREALVITGKGLLGDGVLRRRTPEWLADPVLRPVVAGVSEAHARHGGAGALYVAIKRKAP